MARSAWLLTTLSCTLLAGAQCEERQRLDLTNEERVCRRFVECWYSGESGSAFSPESERWRSMADPRTENNVRAAYGLDGNCWYADPSTGQTVGDAVVAANAQAVVCGEVCACSILELCAARAEVDDPAPPCAAGVEDDPCAAEHDAQHVEMCGES